MSPRPLDAQRLQRTLGRGVHVLSQCASTNALAADFAAGGARGGTLVVADSQTGGRGRLGRSWSSPPGVNLYFSLVLRPQLPLRKLPLVCLAAAVGLAEVLELGIKWPNDLLDARGRKVVGILAELQGLEGTDPAVVLGVGVNVNQLEFDAELPNAGSLAQLRGVQDREKLLADIVPAIEGRVALLTRTPEQVLQAWRERSVTIGRQVRVNGLEGQAVGLRHDGALMVLGPEGVVPVLAGDVQMLATRA